jgi:hypothetical protein
MNHNIHHSLRYVYIYIYVHDLKSEETNVKVRHKGMKREEETGT